MANKIDLVRGVEIRKHKMSGMLIYMYRDDPGVYLNAFEKPVSDTLAKEAGFPVTELGRRKLAKEKLAKAMGDIEAELALSGDEPEVLVERGGYRILRLGLGRANVVDVASNEVVNPQPIPEEVARRLLDELSPEADNTGVAKTGDKPSANKNKENSNGRS